jgi:hypothetical protein
MMVSFIIIVTLCIFRVLLKHKNICMQIQWRNSFPFEFKIHQYLKIKTTSSLLYNNYFHKHIILYLYCYSLEQKEIVSYFEGHGWRSSIFREDISLFSSEFLAEFFFFHYNSPTQRYAIYSVEKMLFLCCAFYCIWEYSCFCIITKQTWSFDCWMIKWLNSSNTSMSIGFIIAITLHA